jgi:hypothetical protein
MDSKKSVTVKTLIYSDIFNFPLTKQEIWKYLISNKKVLLKDFEKLLESNNISKKDIFYFLKGREKIVEKRKKRTKIGLEKTKKAKKIINIISVIPSIYFVGITGSLSLLNSEEKEDIDLFMICAKNTVWITRFLCVIFLKSFGCYRGRGDIFVKDKICLNMIIGEDCLKIRQERQDLYTAHEIAQLMPIFERGKTYNKFINHNLWIKKFLPNSIGKINHELIRRKKKKQIVNVLRILEPIFRKIQFNLMKKHITRETILDNFLAFHPGDHRSKILKEFNNRIKND